MRDSQVQRALEGLQSYLSTPIDALLAHHEGTDAAEAAVSLFQRTAQSVPAYRAFLAERGIDPASVRTVEEFHRLPQLTKQNYIQRYPLADLCRDGALDGCDMIAVSSGSTGKPTFWPRFVTHELGVAARFEQVFYDNFEAHTRRTLAVICFTLGTWVGGMYTAACCRHLAAKGYPITVITPGNNREEIYRAVQELAPLYEQTVLLGYPPFLKDVIDTGIARGIDWPLYDVKLVMAGEVFSEEWRALVAARLGARDLLRFAASIYGTADAGVLGVETPLSIAIRRFLAARPEAARALFGESRLPTLVQYDPMHRFFECVDGGLLFTGDNGIPLVRYNILDTGGVMACSEMLEFLRGWGFDAEGDDRRLPFVWVFGRSDFTVSYFGANIYPENVTVGLERPEIAAWVTGKFVMQAVEDEDRNRRLSIRIELAPGVEASDAKRTHITESIRAELERLNSEFAHYVPEPYRTPDIELRTAGDPDWFPVGVKHRYTRR